MNSILRVGELLRYPKPARPDVETLDGYRNFYRATACRGMTKAQLEKGINPIAMAGPRGERRRPAVLLRSSPWKAGTQSTPWRDHFDLVGRTAVYWGDHKADTPGPFGSTSGNQILEAVYPMHKATDVGTRIAAPPLMLFRTRPWKDQAGDSRDKGLVEFLGIGVMTALARVRVTDDDSNIAYDNYRAELSLCALEPEELGFDWRWINSRRQPVPSAETQSLAPSNWKRWIRS